MTNGEKIQTILDVDRDCIEVHGENETMTFTVTQNFWNAEYKEPTTKNDLGVDCISRQAVLDLINADWKYENLEMEINNLPSVTPQEPFINKPCVSSRICEHDKNKVLDKIRAEINDLTYYWCEVHPRSVIDDVLAIIDKYKAESEDNNGHIS